jgi:hypothetical protein
MPAAALIVLRQTPNAAFAAEEFFKAALSNEHTRRAYGRITGRFLAWCNNRGLELRQVTPGLAGEYIGQLPGSAPTRNQALAALRHFFDALVQRHAVALNPFASVGGIKYSVTEGKTAELAIEQARKLFKTIDTHNVAGLRDHAVLGVLAYTGARIGAVARLRLAYYRNLGDDERRAPLCFLVGYYDGRDFIYPASVRAGIQNQAKLGSLRSQFGDHLRTVRRAGRARGPSAAGTLGGVAHAGRAETLLGMVVRGRQHADLRAGWGER